MNKKTLVIVVAVVVVLAVVLGVVLLGGNNNPTTTTTTTTTTTSGKPAGTEAEYKLGMGVAFGGHTAAQANLTIATVVLDAEGKIVACRLDVAQNKYKIEDEEVVFTVLESKKELLERYNMKGSSAIGKEWYEQAEAFEAWVVGKTGAEVAELLKKDNLQQSGTHWISTDATLLAGCTIDVQDFRDAVVAACNDDQGVTFKTSEAFTLGLGVNSADDKSSCEDEENYTIKLNVEFAASVVINGKIAASLNDAYQPVIKVVDGEVESANVGKTDENYQDVGFMTKRTLKGYYMMAVYGAQMDGDGDGRVLEWYDQSAAFSAHVVGMTGAQVAGMTTTTNNIGYQMSTDSALVSAGCTIQITGMTAVVAESVANAR